ncbi:MAG: ABC transporter permease [Roseburia sp.]|nr:ABC transporter permease [Ruminococcus sp.]MCM1154304.1 ABC transporter permease [Roseburia sp.]MCM1241848.1 ABC transporter permease [Roseburia sp.]
MKNIKAVFWKQLKDTLKNKTILIQFVMFPLMAVLMEHFVVVEGMPEHFFVKLFASMYIGMAPICSMSSILAEEKETCTLKVLLMSDVKPAEYLLGTGSYVWAACMAGACVLAFTGEYKGREFAWFLLIMAVGIMASLLIGAAVGTWSKNQMAAISLGMPVMIVFAFLPMLSMFNETIKKAARFAYSEQIDIMINNIGVVSAENMTVILLNIVIALGLFLFAYRRCGLS